jgi:NAD(P) transhydrogenase subunit alpha
MREGQTLIGFIWPAQNPELMQQLAAKRKATVLAIDCLPRMLSPRPEDGRADLQAGVGLPRRDRGGQCLRPLFQRPDHGRGQGAAGQGLHRRRRRGRSGRHWHGGQPGRHRARQRHRAEVADQVVSLGGEFVKVDYEEEGSGGGGYAKVMSEGFQAAQREMYAKQAKDADIIITTALIPGKPAPKLITAEMVQ